MPAEVTPPAASPVSAATAPCSHSPISANLNRPIRQSLPSDAPESSVPDASRRGRRPSPSARLPAPLPDPLTRRQSHESSCDAFAHCGHCPQRLIHQLHSRPLAERFSSQRLVELDRRLIPVQNVPEQLGAAPLHGNRRDFGQQCFAHATSAKRRPYKQVLQMNAAPPPRGIHREKQCHPRRLTALLGDQAFEIALAPV